MATLFVFVFLSMWPCNELESCPSHCGIWDRVQRKRVQKTEVGNLGPIIIFGPHIDTRKMEKFLHTHTHGHLFVQQ